MWQGQRYTDLYLEMFAVPELFVCHQLKQHIQTITSLFINYVLPLQHVRFQSEVNSHHLFLLIAQKQGEFYTCIHFVLKSYF